MIINLAKIDFGGGTSGGGGGCNLLPWPPYFEATNDMQMHSPAEFGPYDGFPSVGINGYNVDTQYADLEKILNGYSQDELIGRVYTTGPDAFRANNIYAFDSFNKVHTLEANGWENKLNYTYNEDSKSGNFPGCVFTMNDDLSTMNCSLGTSFNWEATYNPNAMEVFSNPVISFTKWMTADRRYVVEFTDEANMTINGETVDYGYIFRNDTRRGYYIPDGEEIAYQLQYNDTSMIIQTIDMGLTEFIPYTEPEPASLSFLGTSWASEDGQTMNISTDGMASGSFAIGSWYDFYTQTCNETLDESGLSASIIAMNGQTWGEISPVRNFDNGIDLKLYAAGFFYNPTYADPYPTIIHFNLVK